MTKGKKRFSLPEKILLLAAAIVFLFSAWQIGNWLYAGYESRQVTDRLAAGAVTIQKIPEDDAGQKAQQREALDVSSEAAENTEEIPISVDFGILRQSNPDIIAWIYSPGTKINYPIVQGEDNSYYLHRLVNGEKNAGGTLFMDCNNAAAFADGNTIIYGHHMKNGSMFASLEKYKKQSYYDAHPVFYLLTPDKAYRLEVFAGFVTAADSEVYTLQFSAEDRESWLDKMTAQSDFQTDIRVQKNEPVVTLSTCDYTYEDARYVVMGVLR